MFWDEWLSGIHEFGLLAMGLDYLLNLGVISCSTKMSVNLNCMYFEVGTSNILIKSILSKSNNTVSETQYKIAPPDSMLQCRDHHTPVAPDNHYSS